MYESKNKESKFLNDNLVFLMIGATVIFLIILFFLLEAFIPISSNNGTLVVEIGVGIVIAIIVHRISKKTEKKNTKFLKNMDLKNEKYLKELKKIVTEEKSFRDDKRREIYHVLRDVQLIIVELTKTEQSESEISKLFARLISIKYNLKESLEKNSWPISTKEKNHLSALLDIMLNLKTSQSNLENMAIIDNDLYPVLSIIMESFPESE